MRRAGDRGMYVAAGATGATFTYGAAGATGNVDDEYDVKRYVIICILFILLNCSKY